MAIRPTIQANRVHVVDTYYCFVSRNFEKGGGGGGGRVILKPSVALFRLVNYTRTRTHTERTPFFLLHLVQ